MALRVSHSLNELHFYGHGKLLITSEYFVLDGALALALPTKFGQHLRVKELSGNDGLLYWVALNSKKQPWLNLVIDKEKLQCINTDSDEASRLVHLLGKAREINPDFLSGSNSVAVETVLEFPNEWGLGSSSTLIHCIAAWAGVNGHILLKETMGGSGYDVACAAHHNPIVYQLSEGVPQTEEIRWKPDFANQLYFAYLGQKQLSSEGIRFYREKLKDKSTAIELLSKITKQILSTNSLVEFEEHLAAHEAIVAEVLGMQCVKQKLFSDFNGQVKSLGAWGGDFVLMTSSDSEQQLKKYLYAKGIDTVFNWEEIILSFPTWNNH